MSEPEPITLLFGGDFAPLGGYEVLIADRDGDVFGEARSEISAADPTLVNLESPLCGNAVAIEKSGPAIRAAPDTLQALSVNGVNAVCLANNHIFDFGKIGLVETLAALRARGIQYVGAGLDRSEAEAPLRIVIKNKLILIYSFAEREFNIGADGVAGAALLDPLRLAPLLLAGRKEADTLIVCVHAGNEYFPFPRPGLRKICHFIVEMGADAVIGHHPHVPGAYEIHREKPIFYSLGNLIFDNANPSDGWNLGYFVKLKINYPRSGAVEIKPALIPYRQSVDQAGVRLLDGIERSDFLARIENMRDQLESRPSEWLAAWQAFVDVKSSQAAIDLYSPFRFRGLRRLMKFAPLRKLISPPSRRLHRLNMLRCQSHRELVISAMECASDIGV